MAVIGFIHTVPSLAGEFTTLAGDFLPAADTLSVVDETLLRNAIAHGQVDESGRRRLADHVEALRGSGAQAVMVTCSSLGTATDLVAAAAAIPVFRVDRAMVDRALGTGHRIAVVATLPSTLGPTADLVRRRAAESGQSVDVRAHVCEGAFAALRAGRRPEHDELVRSAVRAMARDSDVVILAQASMAGALAGVEPLVDKPVLSSPRLAVEYLAGQLG